MYIRFVANRAHPTLDAELGMFEARNEVDFSRQRGSLQRAHDEAFYWFKAGGAGGLTYPKLKGKVRNTKIRRSLFWFPVDASFWRLEKGSVVRRARELANVLTEAGCPIREIKMADIGEIIWKDPQQVLAFPDQLKIPKAF